MNKSNDLVIGCIDNYEWSLIEPWAISLTRSGFTGKKLVIVYNCSYATIDKLGSLGFNVLGFSESPNGSGLVYIPPKKPWSVVVSRFRDMWNYLNLLGSEIDHIRYIIATDVRDVVFQSDPSTWIEQNLNSNYKICAASEELYFKNHRWANKNMKDSFDTLVGNYMTEKLVLNAGCIAGEAKYVKDLFLQIFLQSNHNPIVNPDQAALNVILSLSAWQNITLICKHESGWAAQCGTTVDPKMRHEYGPHLIDAPPCLHDGIIYPQKAVLNSDGVIEITRMEKPFCIVHQYDREPTWKQVVEERFREAKLNS